MGRLVKKGLVYKKLPRGVGSRCSLLKMGARTCAMCERCERCGKCGNCERCEAVSEAAVKGPLCPVVAPQRPSYSMIRHPMMALHSYDNKMLGDHLEALRAVEGGRCPGGEGVRDADRVAQLEDVGILVPVRQGGWTRGTP